MKTELLRFHGAVERDPAIDSGMKARRVGLGAIAHQWFEVMRKCGNEVRELLHDGSPVACLGDAPFGCLNVFAAHLHLGSFTAQHCRIRRACCTALASSCVLSRLIDAAYADLKARVESG